MINFDTFKQVELRTAVVRSAERVEGSEKLLKILVDLGSETRQIVSGIGKEYTPESLEGKTVVIAANLEPRMLMGLESQGMLLAATDETGALALLTTDHSVLPGAPVS